MPKARNMGRGSHLAQDNQLDAARPAAEASGAHSPSLLGQANTLRRAPKHPANSL
jgi:hypothetical protein